MAFGVLAGQITVIFLEGLCPDKLHRLFRTPKL